MAVDIYMTIPGIPGESTALGFGGAIEVYSFSWGITNPFTQSSSGSGAGKPQFSDVAIVKKFDLASPLLMKALATGSQLTKVVLSFVQASPTLNPVTLLTYEFDMAYVTSLQNSTSEDLPTEAVSFAYEKVVVTYYEQNKKGGRGKPEIFVWNL